MIWPLLYAALWKLAPPLIGHYLRRRARKQPEYLQHWDERWARGEPRADDAHGAIWVHAVSVGETRAAAPLVAALRARWPDKPLLITQMTPTGRETALSLYPDACVRYLPYDAPDAVARFLGRYQPMFGVLMETELWPHLIAGCRAHGVPLFLVNARLSERSARGYRRAAGLIGPALASLDGVAAQSEDDAARLRALGARQVAVCGNLKFDITPPPQAAALAAQLRQWRGERPLWMAASTREGEEALLLDALPADSPAVLLLTPRHPQRFAEVGELLRARGIPFQRRSDNTALRADTRVWLGDSMGEMFAYYQAVDLAFIGGSLLPLGGQNLIEPAAVGCPVLIGPSTFNFAEVTRLALAEGAARQVADADELHRTVATLLADPDARQRMGAAGQAFAQRHRGATARTLAHVLGCVGEAVD